jgi:hypothetical protein
MSRLNVRLVTTSNPCDPPIERAQGRHWAWVCTANWDAPRRPEQWSAESSICTGSRAPVPGYGEVLRQSGTAGQAKIVSLIQRSRVHLEQGQSLNASDAKIVDPEGYDRLVRAIEHQLYRWVLLKLQTVGGVSDLFIYELPSGLTRAARVPAPVRGWTATEAWGRGPPGQIRALVAPAHPATLGAARGRSFGRTRWCTHVYDLEDFLAAAGGRSMPEWLGHPASARAGCSATPRDSDLTSSGHPRPSALLALSLLALPVSAENRRLPSVTPDG